VTRAVPSNPQSPIERDRYDVIIAGARCAGASTAMLLARQGLRVLVVDPTRRGSDTLSTHALMRGAVLQLHRWGVLDDIRAAGTPAIRTTTFHYGDEDIEVPIKEQDGVDALYAPRRTVIDPVLLDAAEAAGAEVVLGYSVVDLLRSDDGRVCGARIAGADRHEIEVASDVVIGADGLRSHVAQMVEAEQQHTAPHATASIYSYRQDFGLEGFEDNRKNGLEELYQDVLNDVSPTLAKRVAGSKVSGKIRGFAGVNGFLRRSAGPGWALVGDAAYFKDPLTAHGITDALRDAELLARAVTAGGDEALAGYQSTRDELVGGLFDVTDKIASFDWDLAEAKAHHLILSKEMNAEVALLRTLDNDFVAAPAESSSGR